MEVEKVPVASGEEGSVAATLMRCRTNSSINVSACLVWKKVFFFPPLSKAIHPLLSEIFHNQKFDYSS